MKPVLVLAAAVALLAGTAQAAPLARQTLAVDSLVDTVRGGHGHVRGRHVRGHRGLHRGWSIGRGNPHRRR